MLHEEVHLKWEEVQSWVQDFHLLESLRNELVVGVSENMIDLLILHDLNWSFFKFFLYYIF